MVLTYFLTTVLNVHSQIYSIQEWKHTERVKCETAEGRLSYWTVHVKHQNWLYGRVDKWKILLGEKHTKRLHRATHNLGVLQ